MRIIEIIKDWYFCIRYSSGMSMYMSIKAKKLSEKNKKIYFNIPFIGTKGRGCNLTFTKDGVWINHCYYLTADEFKKHKDNIYDLIDGKAFAIDGFYVTNEELIEIFENKGDDE